MAATLDWMEAGTSIVRWVEVLDGPRAVARVDRQRERFDPTDEGSFRLRVFFCVIAAYRYPT